MRRRTPQDFPACLRILADCHAHDAYPSRWPEDPVGWLSPAGCEAGWIAERAGTVIGHVIVVRGVDDAVVTAASGASPGQLAAVSRLFVAPHARGEGVAALLMRAVSAYARVLGLQLMLDVVEDGGSAVAFYQRLGWREVDRRLADWVTPDGQRLPVRIYLEPQPRRMSSQ